MKAILENALGLFNMHSGWIVWNLFLAFIPLVLSFWLFRRKTNLRSWVWWLVFLIFVAFLPNAPYLLTDIIHLIKAIRTGYSVWVITLIFIPLHLVAILAGMEAYVIAIINLGHYLKRQGLAKLVIWAEFLAHALCAIGVYLGRFRRFNSWDLVTQPEVIIDSTFDDLTSKLPLLAMLITFVVITCTYWSMKQITLGLILQFHQSLKGGEDAE